MKRSEAILAEATRQLGELIVQAENELDGSKSGSALWYESWGRFNGLALALGTINRLRRSDSSPDDQNASERRSGGRKR